MHDDLLDFSSWFDFLGLKEEIFFGFICKASFAVWLSQVFFDSFRLCSRQKISSKNNFHHEFIDLLWCCNLHLLSHHRWVISEWSHYQRRMFLLTHLLPFQGCLFFSHSAFWHVVPLLQLRLCLPRDSYPWIKRVLSKNFLKLLLNLWLILKLDYDQCPFRLKD